MRRKGFQKCSLCGKFDFLKLLYYPDEEVIRKLCPVCFEKETKDYE
jgi:hypothetical protein